METNLATEYPELAAEWNHAKNGGVKPGEVAPHSNKKYWWKCEKGHEWEAEVNSRANGRGCPYCANKKVLKGFNDLATIHPELAKQ